MTKLLKEVFMKKNYKKLKMQLKITRNELQEMNRELEDNDNKIKNLKINM